MDGATARRRRRGHAALLAASLAALLRAAGGGSVLVKGVTRNGLVSAGASKFFKLQLACPDTAESLQLSLTALEGNPDLYVSASLQQPGPDGFTWRAAAAGSDALTLNFPDAGVYYLAVHGGSAAAFKLQARVTLTTGALRGRTCVFLWRARAENARPPACADARALRRACAHPLRVSFDVRRACAHRASQAACPARASACWTTTRRWWTAAVTSASCLRMTWC
jgi:hypothetical protein